MGAHAPKSGGVRRLLPFFSRAWVVMLRKVGRPPASRAYFFIRFYRFLGGYTPKKHWIFSRETGWSCSEFCSKMVDFKQDVGDGYSVAFIFSPEKKDLETAYTTISNANVKFPLFLDKEGVFSADNNSIPKEPELHVFLLDKNRKVILAGDPSHNPALWRLYKKIIVTMLENGGAMP